MSNYKNQLKIVDYQLLKNYLEGRGTEEDKQKIKNWFSSLQAEQELRKVSHDIWNDIVQNIVIHGYDEARIQDRINHLLRLEEAMEYNKNKAKIRIIRYLTRIAAVLFIPLLLFTLYNWEGKVGAKESISYAEIYSPLGARTNFILPDGSSGWLNGNSYLNFPIEFKGKCRKVKLTGEAYFNVKEDPEMPFTVVTDGIKVKAYGTSFNVMAYPDDRNIEVTLESGDVEIFRKDDYGRDLSIDKLIPEHRGVYIKRTNLYNTDKVNVDKYISWKNGELVFRNEPMTEVVKRINRWYNVRIIIKDKKLESYSYRATFVDETLDEVLKLLKLTSPIEYQDLGRKILPDGTYGKRTIELYYKYK